MTTSPDTIHGAEATIADQATTASAGTVGRTVDATVRTQPRPSRPDLDEEPNSGFQRFLVGLFVAIPLAALVAAIPLLWGWGFLGWHDVVIALVFYWVSGLGITVG